MKLFSGSSNKELADKVANKLGIALSPIDVHIFPDGERRIRVSENVVGEHAFVLQTANTPVDTNYMELFFLIDALKRSGASRVSVIVPYFGYQRQDHVFREGEAVSLEVVISILERLGIDQLVSVDMHSVKIPDLFTLPVSHVSALPVFADAIQKEGWHAVDTVLVSPDKGGIARIKKLSELLDGMSYVSLVKNRDLETGEIAMAQIDGQIQGKKRALIIDDMLSSGKTAVLAAEKLKEQGIEEVSIFATHAIFSEDAPERLKNSVISRVYVTDTVAISADKQFAKLHILSVADIIAGEIRSLTAA